jgi:hypothetical protein
MTLITLIFALASFAVRVFWWTQKQFSDCYTQIWNKPQPAYCGVPSELNWVMWYGPLVTVAMAVSVLVLRGQGWHSSRFTPVVVFWFSIVSCVPKVLMMLLVMSLRNMH